MLNTYDDLYQTGQYVLQNFALCLRSGMYTEWIRAVDWLYADQQNKHASECRMILRDVYGVNNTLTEKQRLTRLNRPKTAAELHVSVPTLYKWREMVVNRLVYYVALHREPM